MTTTSQTVLRDALLEDRELLYRVYESTRLEELAPAGWPPAQLDAFLRMQFDAQDRFYRDQYTDASYYVIEIDGEAAGRLYLARWKKEIRIMDIALLPAFRGRGVGTSLLRDVLHEADQTTRVTSIHVEHNNPAKKLYERLGFVEAEDRGVYMYMVRPPAT